VYENFLFPCHSEERSDEKAGFAQDKPKKPTLRRIRVTQFFHTAGKSD
jgi:hypothetical protein